jgi:hypothetical protein
VTVARAKRTTRAEARRRYRADHGLPEETSIDDEASEVEAPSRRTQPVAGQPARMGIGAAFRQAFRPLDLRGDLQALPRLLRDKAFIVPVLLTVAATALVLSLPRQATPAAATTPPPADVLSLLAAFSFTYFIQPPAFGGVLISGFFAPRASWLLGGLVGLVSAVCYAAWVLSTPAPVTPPAVSATEVILLGFVFSAISGALFASAAAWYRRFLQLSSPNRGRARPPAKRGNDGRSRAANQKAGARR